MPRNQQSRDTSVPRTDWQTIYETRQAEATKRENRVIALEMAVKLRENRYGTTPVGDVLKDASTFEDYLNDGKIEVEPQGTDDTDPLAEWEHELLSTPAPIRRAPRRNVQSRSQKATQRKGKQ